MTEYVGFFPGNAQFFPKFSRRRGTAIPPAYTAHDTKTRKDHFLLSSHCRRLLLRSQFSERRYPGARYHGVPVTFCHCQQLCFASTTLLRGHSLNPSFLPFYFFFTSFVSMSPTIFLPLSYSHARTHAHSIAFFPFLLSKTRVTTHRRAPARPAPIASENQTGALRSGFGERASERIRNPRGVSLS